MKLRKLLFISASLTLFSIGIYAQEQELTGTVVPILTSTLAFGGNGPYRGEIDFVQRQGSIIFPDINDLNGDIAIKGDTLVSLDLQYWEGRILLAQGKIDSLKANLTDAEQNYLRDKKLVKTLAVSIETSQASESTYFQTQYDLIAAKRDLKEAQIQYDAFAMIPTPYPAKVDKVFVAYGLLATCPNLLTITELDLIWVEVEIPRSEARKITNNTPVTIFPAGGEKPMGVIHGHGRLTDKGYQFAVHNQTLTGDSTVIEGKTVPVVRKCLDVYPIDLGTNKVVLSVPTSSIFKDEKGSFVWKAEHQKDLIPNKGIAKSFPLRKVYVETGVEQPMDGYINYSILKDSKILSPFDLVVTDPPDNIKDGDFVSFVNTIYLLMPGDIVKIIIGNQQEGNK